MCMCVCSICLEYIASLACIWTMVCYVHFEHLLNLLLKKRREKKEREREEIEY